MFNKNSNEGPMRKITLICVGDLKEKYWLDAINEYKRRLSRFFDFEIIQLPETKLQKNNPAEIQKVIKGEGDKILEQIGNKKVISLAVEGEIMSSEKFAEVVQTQTDFNSLCFVIGGSYGLDDRVKALGQKLSFGRMTLPHQLMRVVFIEQLYRAGTIMNNIEYHK